MDNHGRYYDFLVRSTASGKGIGEAIARAGRRWGDSDAASLRTLAGRLVAAVAVASAMNSREPDWYPEDADIPLVPGREGLYNYTLEVEHNPGELVYIEVPSDRKLNFGELMVIAKSIVASFVAAGRPGEYKGGPQHKPYTEYGGGRYEGIKATIFHGTELDDIPEGKFSIRVLRAERYVTINEYLSGQ